MAIAGGGGSDLVPDDDYNLDVVHFSQPRPARPGIFPTPSVGSPCRLTVLFVRSWNGDGTDGGHGGRVGYRRAAHVRAASLQPTVQSGRAQLSDGRVGAAPLQAFHAAAAAAVVTVAAVARKEDDGGIVDGDRGSIVVAPAPATAAEDDNDDDDDDRHRLLWRPTEQRVFANRRELCALVIAAAVILVVGAGLKGRQRRAHPGARRTLF